MAQLLKSLIRNLLGHRNDMPKLGACLAHLGLRGYFLLNAAHKAAKTKAAGVLLPLRSSHAQHKLFARNLTSDLQVFAQIFVDREYSAIDDLTHIALVLDLGANVGYSSSYFLTRFPECQVIAVEPDPENFEILKTNLKSYGSRAKSLQTGVWSHRTRLKISSERFRDGKSWSRQVEECSPTESGFMATDIETLLSESGHQRISLLKIDIEGAEAVVFAKNYQVWLDRVDTLIIELHKDSMFGDGYAVVTKVMAEQKFSVTTNGELHIFRRNTTTTAIS